MLDLTILDLFGTEGLDSDDHISPTTSTQMERLPIPETVPLSKRHAHNGVMATERYKFIEYVHDATVVDFRGTDLMECGCCRRYHSGEIKLYDLRKDPSETESIDDERSDVVERLRERFTSNVADLAPITAEYGLSSYEDEEVMKRLEHLGYR